MPQRRPLSRSTSQFLKNPRRRFRCTSSGTGGGNRSTQQAKPTPALFLIATIDDSVSFSLPFAVATTTTVCLFRDIFGSRSFSGARISGGAAVEDFSEFYVELVVTFPFDLFSSFVGSHTTKIWVQVVHGDRKFVQGWRSRRCPTPRNQQPFAPSSTTSAALSHQQRLRNTHSHFVRPSCLSLS